MQIIDGKVIANTILNKLKSHVISPTNLTMIVPQGETPSKTYVKNKIKACDFLNISHNIIEIDEKSSQEDVILLIKKLNNDKNVNGILCQFPFPNHFNETLISETIDPLKDVDCFHPYNIGKLSTGNPLSMPVTPYGIYQILNLSNIEVKGKHMVIIGRGNTVGKPLSILMSLKGMDATVTLCHSFTEKIKDITRHADILVAAFGEANVITSDYISDGCTVIDVGLNYIFNEQKKKNVLTGDVDFESVKNKAHAITPVPGGVGPVTVAMLMYNIINLSRVQQGLAPLSIF